MRMMHMSRSCFLVLLMLLGLSVIQAQQRPSGAGRLMTSVSGRVFDSKTGSAVQYANVMLHQEVTGESVTGTITNEEGRFQITPVRPGQYYVTVKFMGYEELRVDSVIVTMALPNPNLGDLEIHPAALEGEAVEVVRERTSIEYKIDKKVINVGQDLTSSSGSAVEVLENVPSVTVDIDGNVELRGSSNFTVLIDNRPSILEANDALQTIPASTIENIEIITNPSAAYDPDGVSGIINIITKKNRLEGISGIANLRAGQLGQLGGDFLVNYRNDKYTVYLSAAYGNRVHQGQDSTWSQTTISDTTNHLNSFGDRQFSGHYFRLRSGLDYHFTDKDVLGLQLSYGSRGFVHDGDNAYEEYNVYPDSMTVPVLSTTESESERGGVFYDMRMNYEHQFTSPQHRLQARLDYGIRDNDEESKTEQFNTENQLISGTRTLEAGPVNRGRFELDYEQPFMNEGELEAGYHLRFGHSEDESSLETWDSTDSIYVVAPLYDHSTSYTRFIHSLFLTASTNLGKWGVQGGLRGEYTFREIELIDGDETYTIDRPDLFPSLHLSYNLSELDKLMASYSRRIDRPRGWFLEPFETWMDAYNVRVGNPDLQPEFIHSFEMGYLHYFGKRNMFSAELYGRQTENLVERIQSVYDENIILHTFDNVGNSLSLGTELALRIAPVKWWNLNLMGNIYHYEINDTPAELGGNVESDNWNLRFNNDFTLNKLVRLQLNTMYNSPSVTAQGERDAMVFVNAGARLNLIENKLSASINVRDLLDTGDHESITEGQNFYRRSVSDRLAPLVSVSLRYNFNNYRDRNADQNGNGMNGGEGEAGDDF